MVHINVNRENLAELCRRRKVSKLSFFGSVLRDDFGPDSDVDMLVEFEAGAAVSLLDLAEMEIELSEILGRRVDLRTPAELSRHFRDKVLATAEPEYVRR